MKQFEWPVSWAKQQQLEQPKELLVFGEMLPECVGFVAKNGENVFYGEDYRNKLKEGRIKE